MKRFRHIIAWLLLCASAACLALNSTVDSDQRREAAIRARYGGFSGVLRLWTCERLNPISGWLNGCIAAFEKRHGGVYIQLTEVDGDALKSFADGQATPPDMLIVYPGLLENTAHLLPIEGEYPLRAGLESVGLSGEKRYALPVAMGAYGLAYNCALLDALPADWSALPSRPAASKSFKKQAEAFWLDWPRDTAAQSWSAALLALFSDISAGGQTRSEAPVGEGIDLGLPLADESAALPTQAPADSGVENRLPKMLPDSFRREGSVYASFAKAAIAAMPVAPREIRRLQQLSEGGKAPDWAVGTSETAFTDQIALIAVTDCVRPALSERQALCLEFSAFLLAEDSQRALKNICTLPAIDTAPLYSGESGMNALENSLAGRAVVAPPAFENGWRNLASVLADQAAEGTLTPRQAWRRLESALKSAAQ